MPLFEIKSKMWLISAHKRVTALKFCTAVAFVVKIMGLWRNSGGTAGPVENRRFPPNFCLPFLAIIENFQSSEINFFFHKNFAYIFTWYLTLFLILTYWQKNSAVPAPFLHSSILFSTKATAVPNFRVITLLWAEIMHDLLLVSKSDTSSSPLYCLIPFLSV